MDIIKLDDLKAYRDNRIASGNSDFDEMDRLSAFIANVETIEPKRGKPDFADCEKCSRTYGTFGCCSTVSNEWVYSCLEGMLEKAYADGIKSVETMIRYDELIKMELPTATDVVKAIREAEYRGYMKAVEDRPQGMWIDYQGKPMRLYESYSATCSVCGEWSEYLTDYCPNCGARMEGADDEID